MKRVLNYITWILWRKWKSHQLNPEKWSPEVQHYIHSELLAKAVKGGQLKNEKGTIVHIPAIINKKKRMDIINECIQIVGNEKRMIWRDDIEGESFVNRENIIRNLNKLKHNQ